MNRLGKRRLRNMGGRNQTGRVGAPLCPRAGRAPSAFGVSAWGMLSLGGPLQGLLLPLGLCPSSLCLKPAHSGVQGPRWRNTQAPGSSHGLQVRHRPQ